MQPVDAKFINTTTTDYTPIETWVIANSSVLSTIASWFAVNNTKISRYNAWVESNSDAFNAVISATDSFAPAFTWLQSNSAVLADVIDWQSFSQNLNRLYTEGVSAANNWVQDNSATILGFGEWIYTNSADVDLIPSILDTQNIHASAIQTNADAIDYTLSSVTTLTREFDNYNTSYNDALIWVNSTKDSLNTWVESASTTISSNTNNISLIIDAITALDIGFNYLYGITDDTYEWMTDTGGVIMDTVSWVHDNSSSVDTIHQWYDDNASSLNRAWVSGVDGRFESVSSSLNIIPRIIDAITALDIGFNYLYGITDDTYEWMTDVGGSIDDTVSWVHDNSSSVGTIRQWHNANAATLTTAWTSAVSSNIASISADVVNLSGVASQMSEAVSVLDITANYLFDLTTKTHNWVADTSSAITDAVTWTHNNSSSVGTIRQWHNANAATLNTTWASAVSSNITSLIVDVVDLSGAASQMSEAISALDITANYLFDITTKTHNWVLDTSSSVADTKTWVQGNSADLYNWYRTNVTWSTNVSGRYGEAATWVESNSAGLSTYISWTIFLMSLSQATSEHIQLEERVFTWVQENSSSFFLSEIVTPQTAGSASTVPVVTINQYGLVTNLSTSSINIAPEQIQPPPGVGPLTWQQVDLCVGGSIQTVWMLMAFPVITEGTSIVLAQDSSTALAAQQTDAVLVKQGS